MKTSFRSIKTSSHRVKLIAWLVASSLILGTSAQDTSNATAAPEVTEVEMALNCGNERVTQSSRFAAIIGGKPTGFLSSSTHKALALPEDSLDRPVCGGVTPGGKGYWFPVMRGSVGEIDLLFCTATETPVTMTVTVYEAPLVSEGEITNCEDTTCAAIGTKHPVLSEDTIRTQGDICLNATNSGGVHFTASDDQLYFVHVDVTTDLTELLGFEAISYVTSSSSSLSTPPPVSSPSSPTTPSSPSTPSSLSFSSNAWTTASLTALVVFAWIQW